MDAFKSFFLSYWDLIRPFGHDWFDYAMTGFFILLTIVAVLMVVVTLYLIVNWFDGLIGTGGHEGIGEVLDKSYSPPGVMFIKAGSVMVPTHTPPSWELYVGIGDEAASVSVNKRFYKSIRVGEELQCKYRIGRFLKNIHIDEMEAV